MPRTDWTRIQESVHAICLIKLRPVRSPKELKENEIGTECFCGDELFTKGTRSKPRKPVVRLVPCGDLFHRPCIEKHITQERIFDELENPDLLRGYVPEPGEEENEEGQEEEPEEWQHISGVWITPRTLDDDINANRNLTETDYGWLNRFGEIAFHKEKGVVCVCPNCRSHILPAEEHFEFKDHWTSSQISALKSYFHDDHVEGSSARRLRSGVSASFAEDLRGAKVYAAQLAEIKQSQRKSVRESATEGKRSSKRKITREVGDEEEPANSKKRKRETEDADRDELVEKKLASKRRAIPKKAMQEDLNEAMQPVPPKTTRKGSARKNFNQRLHELVDQGLLRPGAVVERMHDGLVAIGDKIEAGRSANRDLPLFQDW